MLDTCYTMLVTCYAKLVTCYTLLACQVGKPSTTSVARQFVELIKAYKLSNCNFDERWGKGLIFRLHLDVDCQQFSS
jgi:hypothetical protein